MAKKVYAVKNGRKVGIFFSWDECKASVANYSGAIYKGFLSEAEAKSWLGGDEAREKSIPKREVGIPRNDEKILDAEYIVYTDGSCLRNPDGPGGWAAVVVDTATGEVKELSGGNPSTTNNRMEMTAAIRALETLAEGAKIALYTDSQYMKNAFTKRWLANWKRNGWLTREGSPVLNQDLWVPLDKLVFSRRVTFRWVKGHVGVTHNERCDVLAKGEAKKFL